MLSLFKDLGWFYKSHKKAYLIAFISLIFIDIFILVPPMLVGTISDGLREASLSYRDFLLLIGLLYTLAITNYVLGYFADFNLFSTAYGAMHETRTLIMKKLIKQNPFFFFHHSSGEIMSRSTSDVSSLGDYTGFGMMALMDSTFYPAIILLLMARISWQLTLVSILPFPLLIISSKYLEDKIETSFSAAQKKTDELSAMVLAHARGLRVLRAYVQEGHQEKLFETLSLELRDKRNEVSKYVTLFSFITRAVPGLGFFLAMVFGSFLIKNNSLSLGGLVSINLYLGMLSWPMMAFGEYISVNQQAKTSWQRIDQLLSFEDEPLPLGGEKHPGWELSLSNVDFKYEDETGLSGIDLELTRGKRLGIVGPIGSGKTTLLRQLLTIYPPAKGIEIDGSPLDEVDLSLFRRGIGFVPQEHVLFSKSLKDNILLGEEEDHERLLEVLDQAGFTSDLEEMPKGLDAPLGENGVNLSGGQKQRLSLARALYPKPKILILDDTLSAVDNITQAHIESRLDMLPSDMSLVIVSHRLSAVKNCQEIIVMKDGSLEDRGTHQELLAKRGWYYDQWLKQGGGDD